MRVEYKEGAIRQLMHLPPALQKRITDKIDYYASQQNPLAHAKKLTGYDAYRYRIGDFRAIFEVAGDTLAILRVVKRDGAYRDL